MQKTVSFKRKIIATTIASLAAGFGSMAYAQNSGETEEIVVTGIKASLQRAVDIKRDAAGVVDAISSEDIGKMPDANLAESLQRITGISIDRTNGEGAKITSRGFGPEYNLVTLNGRQLSSASIGEGGGIDGSRSFDMSNIASESVSGVQVYKTGKANIPTGGIGATVNLTTAKPFDHEGFKASVGGKALYDQSNDIGTDITPELSGFVSWSDEMFGASLSLTHQERTSGRSGFAGPGWGDILQNYPADHNKIWSGGYSPGAVIVNEPTGATPNVADSGDLATRPQEAHFFHTDSSRRRDNGLLTLQFKPTDKITATLDYLKTETKMESQEDIYSLWFSDGAWPTNGVKWDGSKVSASPVYMWQSNYDSVKNKYYPRDIALKNGLRTADNKLDDLGLNVGFEATDELSFVLDVHHSKSSSTPWYDRGPGSNITLGIGVNTIIGQGLDMSGDLPLVASVLNNGSIKKSDVGSTISQLVSARAWSDVKEAKVTGQYKFSDSGSIDFGFDSLSTEVIQKQSDIGNATMRGGWSVNAPGDINPQWFELINFNKYFDGYRSELSPGAKAFFSTVGHNAEQATSNITGVRVTNFNAVARAMFADSPDKIAYAANPVDGTDRKIAEDIQAAFVSTSLDGTLGDMKVNVNAGLRYETTDVESYSHVSPRVLKWTSDRDFDSKPKVEGQVPYTVSDYHYNNVLPNLDLTLHITDSLIARASSSKTISRPGYDKLQMGASGAAPNGPVLATGTLSSVSDGNVKLKPVESNNIDFSVEYYFNDTDYVSIGFFDKRVPNFIGTTTSKVTYAGTQDPSAGPRAIAASNALKAAGIAVTDRNLFEMVARMNDTAHGCIEQKANGHLCGAGGLPSGTEDGYQTYKEGVDIVAVAGDPGVINNTTMPTNSKDAVLNGWEFAGQHFFGDSGFGLQVNYTVVNGSIGYNVHAPAPSSDNALPQFALTGLSDSANVVGIYEKDQWQARIAYNWRDKFLDNPNANNLDPEFTKAFGQVDFNVGYKITEDLTVALEGTNVLGADKKTYGRTTNQVRYIDVLEPRYALSARYNF